MKTVRRTSEPDNADDPTAPHVQGESRRCGGRRACNGCSRPPRSRPNGTVTGLARRAARAFPRIASGRRRRHARARGGSRSPGGGRAEGATVGERRPASNALNEAELSENGWKYRGSLRSRRSAEPKVRGSNSVGRAEAVHGREGPRRGPQAEFGKNTRWVTWGDERRDLIKLVHAHGRASSTPPARAPRCSSPARARRLRARGSGGSVGEGHGLRHEWNA
jgi:hypothetical protein